MLQGMEYRDWINSKIKINQEFLYLTQADCRSLGLTDEEVMDMTAKAMISYSLKNAEMPAKIGIHPLKDTLMHAMPASMGEYSSCGIKWGCCFPENSRRFGYPQTTCTLILNDYESGAAISFMDAVYITEVRTAAVAVLSAKKFAPKNFTKLGMIGCGVQGKQQVRMMLNAFPDIEEVLLVNRSEKPADDLIAMLQPTTSAKIRKSSFEEIANNCQVIMSAAYIPARPNPQIKDEWLFKKGQTIIASDCHTFYEDATPKSADKYLCDSIAEHELFIGYGLYPWGLPEIYGETGEVLAGVKAGRENEEEFCFINNVGMAVEDIIMARRIFDLALERGIGRILPL